MSLTHKHVHIPHRHSHLHLPQPPTPTVQQLAQQACLPTTSSPSSNSGDVVTVGLAALGKTGTAVSAALVSNPVGWAVLGVVAVGGLIWWANRE